MACTYNRNQRVKPDSPERELVVEYERDDSREDNTGHVTVDNSVEWQVFGEEGTTACIRHKVFDKSVSIQPPQR